MRYIWQKVIGEHYPEDDSLALSRSFIHGWNKKEAINLTFNKPRARKYIQIMQNAKNAIVFKVNTC